MKRFFVIAIPTATLLLFVLLMNSDNLLKHPITQNDNIPESIQSLKKELESEKWEEATIALDSLSEAWNKVVTRVQFSAEKEEINEFNRTMARLKGAIAAKDRSGALMELSEAYEHWDNIGR